MALILSLVLRFLSLRAFRLKFFSHLLILFLIPTFLVYSNSDILTHSPYAEPLETPHSFSTIHYDDVLKLIDEIQSDNFESLYSRQQIDRIATFMAQLALEGALPGDDLWSLQEDIDTLLNVDPDGFMLQTEYDAFLMPALDHGKSADMMLCKSWIAKKWEQVKKFVKKHEKAITIGGAIVAAAATVIIASNYAEKHNPPSQHTGCTPNECTHNENHPPRAPPTPEAIRHTFETQVAHMKERTVDEHLIEDSSLSQRENIRLIGEVIAENACAELEKILPVNPDWQEEVNVHFSKESSPDYIEDLGDRFYHLRGEVAFEELLYQEALENLDKALSINPSNCDAYLDRATTHMHIGNYDQSLADYQAYIEKAPSRGEYVADFGYGFIKGLPKGAKTSGSELMSFATDVIIHPVETASEIFKAFGTLAKLASENEWKTICIALAPEVNELINDWNTITAHQQGERAGFIIGKYGADFIIPSAATKTAANCAKSAKKLTKASQSLKRAEKTLALEALAQSGQHVTAEAMAASGKFANAEKMSGTIAKAAERTGQIAEEAGLGKQSEKLAINFDPLKKDPIIGPQIKLLKDAEIKLEPYTKLFLAESVAREYIHQTGIKTFPRPKGIPENYLVRITDKGVGMEYTHPTNTHISVRVMPGKPHSPNPSQQKPYIIQKKDGKAFDKYGNLVNQKSVEAHIPIDEFIYRE